MPDATPHPVATPRSCQNSRKSTTLERSAAAVPIVTTSRMLGRTFRETGPAVSPESPAMTEPTATSTPMVVPLKSSDSR